MGISKNRFHIGIAFCFAAGLFPLVVSSVSLVQVFSAFLRNQSVNDPTNQVLGCSITIAHVAFANLFAVAMTAIVLTYFGILQRQRWSWWLLFFLLVCSGGNDFTALLIAYSQGSHFPPIPIIPLILGCIGLFLVRKEVFAKSN